MSLIDHFVISENLQDDLLSYEIDSHNNFSYHIAVKCVLNVNVIYYIYTEGNTEAA